MKKIDKFSKDNDVYTFSFILRKKNPLERVILEQLNSLIKDGYTQKDAIMTLMSVNMINNDSAILNASSKNVQSVPQNKPVNDTDTKIAEEIGVAKQPLIEKYQQKLEKQSIENKPATKPNNTDKYNTNTSDEDKAALESLLQSMYD